MSSECSFSIHARNSNEGTKFEIVLRNIRLRDQNVLDERNVSDERVGGSGGDSAHVVGVPSDLDVT